MALIFSYMVANEFFVASGIYGIATIVGNIIHYRIIQSQGQHVTMAGGFAFFEIMLSGLIVGLICQSLVSKYLKKKKPSE